MDALAAKQTRLTKAQKGVLILMVFSVFINYIDRSNLSVAAPDVKAELGITADQLGRLLSAFFWTYAVLQLAGGWLVDRYDVRWVYGIGFLVWSLATSGTGLATSFGTLMILRLVLGMGESVAYPAYSKIIATTFPQQHLGLANSLVDAGSKCGPALGTLIGGLLIAKFGWRSLFVTLGFGSLIWIPLWFRWGPRSQTRQQVRSAQVVGMFEILLQRDAWGTFIGLFCGNYAWYFLLTWLPYYLVTERHFSRELMAFAGSMPFWGIALTSVIGGWASDRWIARGGSPTLVRKTFAVSGLLLTTVLLLPVVVVEDARLAMAFLMAASLSFGLLTSNVWAITQTLSGPEAAGKWTGWQNFIGNLGGVAAPWVTGRIVQKTGKFFLAFVAVSVLLLCGAAAWGLIVRKVAPIKWKGASVAQ
jgi:ACS family D-galactonate transporter-like MFS transporter